MTYREDGKPGPELREGVAAAMYSADDDMPVLGPEVGRRYTYTDYYDWNDGVRRELIEGRPIAMGAPTTVHQDILGNLYVQFWMFLRGKPCRVYLSPFDVRLNADEKDDTVVQPDLLVVCDRTKLSDRKTCKGAPDLIVEVPSPSSASYDCVVKYGQYQKAGVREYWIVDPETRTLRVCLLDDGQYAVTTYGESDVVRVGILPGLTVSMPEVFAATAI